MEVAELREALGPGQPEFRARQIYHALYSGKVADLVQISTLPAPLRKDLAASHNVGLPELAHRYESSDGTKRYLLRLEDQRTIEAVLMPEPGRDTICISTPGGLPGGLQVLPDRADGAGAQPHGRRNRRRRCCSWSRDNGLLKPSRTGSTS